jgi:hypothetical protein
MIGFAVEERCPYCRMFLGRLAVDPAVPVLHDVNCSGKHCRGRRLVFRIFGGTATLLTDAEASGMLSAPAGTLARTPAGTPD